MARKKSENSSSQACDKCGEDLPLDAAHFDRKRGTATGFRTTCKVCRHEERASGLTIPGSAEVKESGIVAISKRFDDEAITALESFASGAGTRVPHVAELWEALAEAFGGPRGIAKQTMATYLAANPGSDRRVKILAMIARMATTTTASGATTRRVEDMTDEELLKYTADSSLRMLATQSPVVLADMMRAAGLRFDGSPQDLMDAMTPPIRVEATVIDAAPPKAVADKPAVAATPEPAPPPIIVPHIDKDVEEERLQDSKIEDEPPVDFRAGRQPVEAATIEEICPIMGVKIVRQLLEVDDVSEL